MSLRTSKEVQKIEKKPRSPIGCGAFLFVNVQQSLFTANPFRGHIWGHKSGFSDATMKCAPKCL
jgi:hypothetical protein